MSVREEDRQRNCPSRGLGIAAAAIGVGVGAALYYFFNKRNDNPDAEGSTTNWNCEETALQESFNNSGSMDTDNLESVDMDVSTDANSDRSHETMCSGSTTDSDSSSCTDSDDDHNSDELSNTSSTDYEEMDMQSELEENSYQTISEHSTTDTSINITINNGSVELNSSGFSIEYIGREDVEETPQFDFTVSFLRDLFGSNSRVSSPRTNVPTSQSRPNEEIQRLANIREQAFRERSWAVEECSICFEPMQRSHEVLALPCTHRFHQPCIMPWLQERQTCPNCRKEA